MLQFIYDLIFGTPFVADVIIAPFPAIALAGMGMSALGGLLANRANNRAMKRMDNRNELVQFDVPPELQEQIDQLGDRNFFLPMLQRLSGNNTQGNFNINAQLAQRGVNSQAMAQELMQAGERQRQQSVRGGMDALEGLRLNALSRSIGQLGSFNQANARLQQQHVNNSIGIRGDHASNQMGLINSVISGIGGSVTQGLGAQMQANAMNQVQPGQTGGQGFDLLSQFDTGGFNLDGFGGGSGGNNALEPLRFGGFG